MVLATAHSTADEIRRAYRFLHIEDTTSDHFRTKYMWERFLMCILLIAPIDIVDDVLLAERKNAHDDSYFQSCPRINNERVELVAVRERFDAAKAVLLQCSQTTWPKHQLDRWFYVALTSRHVDGREFARWLVEDYGCETPYIRALVQFIQSRKGSWTETPTHEVVEFANSLPYNKRRFCFIL